MSTAPRATKEGERRDTPPVRRLALPRRRGPGFGTFREIYGELKKVVWPTRPQVVHLSIIVIIASIAMGIILGVVDWVFTRVVDAFLQVS